MANPKPVLEWQVLLSDAEWDRSESLDDLLGEQAAAAGVRKRHAMQVRTTTLVALVVIGISVWMLRREARAGLAEIEGEIVSAVEAEAWREQARREVELGNNSPEDEQALADGKGANTPQHRIVPASLLPSPVLSGTAADGMRWATSGEAPVEIGPVSLRTGLAMVEVKATDALGHAYREMQFYREVYAPSGLAEWQRTSPQERFWGAERHIESEFFDIYYRSLDAAAVKEVAAQLDGIYAQLAADLGMPPVQERLEIAVLPELSQGVILLLFEEGRLEVASPELLRVPVEMSDGAALLKSIVHPLVTQVTGEALLEDRLRHEWSAMVRGLQLWQIYVGSEVPESSLQERWFWEIVAWLDGNVVEIQSGRRKTPAADLYLLCREFFGWRHLLPRSISLPVICVSESWEAAIRYFITHTPVGLDGLISRSEWETAAPTTWYGDWVQGVFAATVVDYVVEVYGRDALPALVEGFRTHGHWNTLIPEVFGVPMEEFEAGWHEFLQERTLRLMSE